jgi:hypothetical protein
VPGSEAVRIAIIDSGVHPGHPHIAGASLVAGARIGLYQNDANDFLDFQGHGTAVAAAILSHCPDVELVVAKVFDKTLQTRVEVILRALSWCIEEQGAKWVNLSLGTSNPSHREMFLPWVEKATLIAPAGSLPGGIDGVITVEEHPQLPRTEFRRTGGRHFQASGRPRPIPGRAEDDNLSGVSFAVANFTGLAAKQWLATRQTPWATRDHWTDC